MTTKQDTDKLRAEFEAWYAENYDGMEPASPWEAWQAASRRAVPDGHVVVPIDPTDAMVEAGTNECIRMNGVIDPVVHVWDVMIAAAPKKDE